MIQIGFYCNHGNNIISGFILDSIVRGLETSHISIKLAVGTPHYIFNTSRKVQIHWYLQFGRFWCLVTCSEALHIRRRTHACKCIRWGK